MMHRHGRELGARLLAVGLAVCLSVPATASAVPPPARDVAAPPVGGSDGVETHVVEVPVDESLEETTGEAAPPDPMTEAGGGDDDIYSASGSTSGLAVVGVTWAAGTAPEGTDVVLRTRTGETWTEWAPLEQEASTPTGEESADAPGGAGAQLRDGTEPAFVGAVDEVQVAVRGENGQRPRDVRLVVVDPGTDDAGASVATASYSEPRTSTAIIDESAPATSPLAAAQTVGAAQAVPAAASARPTIYTRAQWGADESKMTWTPQVGRVQGAVVHHTAGTNSYTADQVPSVIRGIYAYHADARGWGDIGYNVLVDKFGRAWEGRAGGLDRAIVGGHAVGVNSTMFGISVMGNYEVAAMTSAASDTLSRVIGWKLGLHGVVPSSSTVIGHRDVAQTACPGRNLYGLLPKLRTAAAGVQASYATDRDLSRDLGMDGFADLLTMGGSSASLLTAPRAGWESPRRVGTGWPGARTVAPGDWTGDKVPDLMLVETSGDLWLYPGTSSGGWQPRRQIGRGWQIMNLIIGGHDWNGDGTPDLLARKASDGSLWLYPANGRGGFGAQRQIGAGWAGMTKVAMIGSVGGRPALVTRTSDGSLYTYRGDGRGGFAPERRIFIGTGWNVMTSLIGAELNGDGIADVVARNTAGDLLLYPGTGDGRLVGPSRIGAGWRSFTAVLSAGRQGRGQDFFAIKANGDLMRYVYHGGAGFDRAVATPVPTAGAQELVAPGDWDGDGRPDAMVRRQDGTLILHRGVSGGTFSATGQQVGSGWQGMSQVVGAGNWLGTGVPTLIALERSTGRIWLYPGDGRGGFAKRSLLAQGAQGVDRIVAAGRFGGSRVPDLLTRNAATGALQLRRGNGGGLLGDPTTITTGWNVFSSIVGTGDVDGDGKPDLLAVGADRRIVLYPGNGAGGFRPATRVLATAPVSAVF